MEKIQCIELFETTNEYQDDEIIIFVWDIYNFLSGGRHNKDKRTWFIILFTGVAVRMLELS